MTFVDKSPSAAGALALVLILSLGGSLLVQGSINGRLAAQVERLEGELSATKEELRAVGARLTSALSSGPLNQAFATAGARYEVPVDLLKAVSYAESRWWHRSGSSPSIDGRYGLMGLRRGATLTRAARLLGLSEETLMTNPVENIYGAAAVLRDLDERTANGARPSADLDDWYQTIKAYGCFGSDYVRTLYANEVFRFARQGASRTISGEEIRIQPAAGGGN